VFLRFPLAKKSFTLKRACGPAPNLSQSLRLFCSLSTKSLLKFLDDIRSRLIGKFRCHFTRDDERGLIARHAGNRTLAGSILPPVKAITDLRQIPAEVPDLNFPERHATIYDCARENMDRASSNLSYIRWLG
jgi:hypothetical protein